MDHVAEKVKFTVPDRLKWIVGLPVTHRQRTILTTLLAFANDNAQCWPAKRTLADLARIDLRDLNKDLKKLADAKIISVEKRKLESGLNQTSLVTLHFTHDGCLTHGQNTHGGHGQNTHGGHGQNTPPKQPIEQPVETAAAREQLPANVIELKSHQPEAVPQDDSSQGVFRKGCFDERSGNRLPDIDGLNGSTSHLCEQLARWLAGELGTPDIEAAHAVMRGNVIAYGADRVKAGMADLQLRIASGDCKRLTAGAIVGFIRNASSEAREQPKARTYSDEIAAIVGQSGGYAYARPAD